MNRKELYTILKRLSSGFLRKKIEGELYAYVTESLIMTNLNIIPELEEFADFLAQYHPKPDIQELYGNKELIEKIRVLFKIR